MRWVRIVFRVVLVSLVLSILHYNLPQTDIVKIVATENRRIDFGENSFFWASPDVGTAGGTTRDVFFIQTVQKNGKPMVYRNEDTGWGWPPYFKLNSHNVQTLAASMASRPEREQWVAITHYGWRNEFFTIFPNAIRVRPVDGPDVTVLPWAAGLILVALALMLLALWRIFNHFYMRYLDPIVDSVGDRIDAVDEGASRARGRFRRWLDSWKGKPRR